MVFQISTARGRSHRLYRLLSELIIPQKNRCHISTYFLNLFQYSCFHKNIQGGGAETSRERCLRRGSAIETGGPNRQWGKRAKGGASQATECQGSKAKEPSVQGTKCLLADGQEPAVTDPAAAAPVEVQVALDAVPVQVGHAAAAVRAHPDGAEGD